MEAARAAKTADKRQTAEKVCAYVQHTPHARSIKSREGERIEQPGLVAVDTSLITGGVEIGYE